ncbi:MAG: hypothetical protein AABY22_12910 [Nanoarchaeota archaeon]
MEKELFSFIPLSKRTKVNLSVEGCFVSLSSKGVLRLNVQATLLYTQERKFVRVFYDEQKRTIGLQFQKTINPSKEWRKIWKSKYTHGQALISVGNIINTFGIRGFSAPRLWLNEYEDKTYGQMVYFKVPNKNQLEAKNEKNNAKNSEQL